MLRQILSASSAWLRTKECDAEFVPWLCSPRKHHDEWRASYCPISRKRAEEIAFVGGQ
jgi:hypothetical protein